MKTNRYIFLGMFLTGLFTLTKAQATVVRFQSDRLTQVGTVNDGNLPEGQAMLEIPVQMLGERPVDHPLPCESNDVDPHLILKIDLRTPGGRASYATVLTAKLTRKYVHIDYDGIPGSCFINAVLILGE